MTQEQKTETSLSLEAYSKLLRASIDEEARKGDVNTLDVTLQSSIHTVSSTYVNNIGLREGKLHDIWYTCIQAAKNFDSNNPKQDTLVRLILSAKARGELTRSTKTAAAREGAFPILDDGKVWSDLPFLGRDLVDEWTTRYYSAGYDDDADHRANLAAFVGRLISVGIHNGTAACALSLFREVLETPRPLESAATTGQSEPDASAGDETIETVLSVESLIYALQQLLAHAETGIITLSSDGGGSRAGDVADAIQPQLATLGELAVQSGVAAPAGFSPERWRFWMQRLRELAQCGIEDVASSAETCLTEMRYAGKAVDGPLAMGLLGAEEATMGAEEKRNEK